MEALTLLLMFLTVSGYAHVLQPKLKFTQISGLDRGIRSEMRTEQLGDVSVSEEEKENAAESTEGRKTEEGGLPPELKMAPETSLYLREETKRGEFSTTDLATDLDTDQMDEVKQEEVEEEQGSRLVAGISLIKETEWGKMLTVNQENVEEKGGNGEREDHMVVRDIPPPLSASFTRLGEELIPAPIQITQSQNPSGSPPPVHHHNPPQSHPPTPHTEVSPHSFPLSAPDPTTINHISTSTALPGEARAFLLHEDLLTEVLQRPGHHLKQNELEVEASPNLEDVMVKNMLLKSARQELETTALPPNRVTAYIPKGQAATAKPKEVTFITKDLNKSNPTPKSNKNNPTVELEANKTQPRAVKLMEYDAELTARLNKASPPQPQLTKPSARLRLTTAKAHSMRPMKLNRSSKNKTINKSKEKKRRKDNKTQRQKKKKIVRPTHFPYFKDNYCPPECACYGRVVQCSDKGVDKIPYGIPYNARYILVMNNHIDSIQLDLLNEYVSMEFLVLSNNRLTDGTIEGAFEGIPALKRLYLDRNLLESVPTDLPASLEELRLDNNRLSVISEAVWARCPSLLVLSLSNNSLGNGSDSLPDGALSPLCNLRTLNLDHNQLTSVPLDLPLSIKELYLKGNLIEQFRGGAFDGISELVVLDVSTNRLTNKGLFRDSLLNATHLESLNLEGNRLKQVPRHLPRSLKTLNLEGNLISSIKKSAFGSLKNLEHLGLARNKIFKVTAGAFRTLPVLHQLDLCHNTLRQVPRQLPEALHSVALDHNRIQSVPRDAFCWGDKSERLSRLVRVQLGNNLIDMGKLDARAFRCLRGFQVVHFY